MAGSRGPVRGAAGATALAERLCALTRGLARGAARLRFREPVRFVYNPLVYARRPHEAYLRRYAGSRKRVLLLGMNPGPFGMAQTGVPFGAIEPVRDWLGIDEPVGRPPREHPKRPVEGFACRRDEVSGTRLWGAIAERYGTPERFFRRCFVANLVPLLFLEASGRNRTPDALPAAEREPLLALCGRHLRRTVELLEPEWVVGVGAFAETSARAALDGTGVRIARVLHPSPANPRAGRGWGRLAQGELARQGVCAEGATG